MSTKKTSRKTIKRDTSPHVHQKPKLNFDIDIHDLNWTEDQKTIIDNALNKNHKMTLIDGIWGSGKTILGIYCALQLLKAKKVSNILYVRNIVQSGSGTLGWLGGDLQTRLTPFMLPLMQKLEELLPQQQVKKLITDNYVETQPVALLRGTSYNCYAIVIDEMGCMTKEDILLTLSRVGHFCHVFAIGDSWQTDIKGSGFNSIFEIFNDEDSKENGIYSYKLQSEMHVMRSDFVKFIMKKIRMPK